ncbi:hypothetical protein VTJ04DRAFT_5151 [Mycothermus thermophilus]|uniref:uncharacterized protein n=1 Tax=Humicola insolens TaxID=85995 RepID=UPI00374378D7
MSREEYQVPGSGSQSYGDAPAATGGSSFNQREFDASGSGVIYYICGDCAVRVPLERDTPIRCSKCGARVLYKERTKRMVQFEAR